MNILVVNDDGVQSAGFAALVEGLTARQDVNVFVCAPDGQRSAKSHSITLGQEVVIEKIEFPGARLAYRTSGTPADCTKIGLQFFAEAGYPIDMVYSGINMGSNLARDTLYSGTVGAAAEAALSGIHAVAVSVDDHDAVYFDTAAKLAADVIDLIYGKMDPSVVLSINVPNLPKEEIRGIQYVPLGSQRYYDDKFHLTEGNRYALSGQPQEISEQDGRVNDLMAVSQNYAVITPLQMDLTDYETLTQIEKWSLNI